MLESWDGGMVSWRLTGQNATRPHHRNLANIAFFVIRYQNGARVLVSRQKIVNIENYDESKLQNAINRPATVCLLYEFIEPEI